MPSLPWSSPSSDRSSSPSTPLGYASGDERPGAPATASPRRGRPWRHRETHRHQRRWGALEETSGSTVSPSLARRAGRHALASIAGCNRWARPTAPPWPSPRRGHRIDLERDDPGYFSSLRSSSSGCRTSTAVGAHREDAPTSRIDPRALVMSISPWPTRSECRPPWRTSPGAARPMEGPAHGRTGPPPPQTVDPPKATFASATAIHDNPAPHRPRDHG